MFGLSLTKILFTIGLIVAIWRGWKLLEFFRDKIGDERPTARKSTGSTRRAPRDRGGDKRARPAPERQPEAVDLVACPQCGTYVANDRMFEHARSCPGRKTG